MTKSMDDFRKKKKRAFLQKPQLSEMDQERNMLRDLVAREDKENYNAFINERSSFNERSFNYNSNNTSHNMSQDEAMNFSFSEVKNEKVLGLGHQAHIFE